VDTINFQFLFPLNTDLLDCIYVHTAAANVTHENHNDYYEL